MWEFGVLNTKNSVHVNPTVILLSPRVIGKVVEQEFFPSDVLRARLAEKQRPPNTSLVTRVTTAEETPTNHTGNSTHTTTTAYSKQSETPHALSHSIFLFEYALCAYLSLQNNLPTCQESFSPHPSLCVCIVNTTHNQINLHHTTTHALYHSIFLFGYAL